MKPEEQDENAERMYEKTPGGYKETKALHTLLAAIEFHFKQGGMERGEYIFLKEFIQTAIIPIHYIWVQGLRRGHELSEMECFMTNEEYNGLMGDNTFIEEKE